MSRGKPSADFDGFVQARGASLHRTAVLLTHDSARAEALVSAGLARAARRWKRVGNSPEAYVRSIMLRQWLRSHRKSDGAPSVPAHGAVGAMGDPLAGLTARQRVLVVLTAFHQQSTEQSAASLGISTRRAAAELSRVPESLGVASLAPVATIVADVAESYPPPAPARLTAQIERRRRARRRRAGLVSVAAAVAVIAVGAGAALLSGPVEGSGERVSAAVVDADYSRGYGLVEGTPQPFLDGMALAKTDIIDYSLRRKIISAPEDDDDTQIYAVAYCDLPGNAMDVDAIIDVISVRARGETMHLSCVDRSADLATSPLLKPLPRGVDHYTVTVPAVWSDTGAVHLGLYRETDWSDYPFPPFVERQRPPDVPAGFDVVNAKTVPRTDPALDWLLEEGQHVQAIEVDVDTRLDVTAITEEPGQLLIALDGVVITNDGEELTSLGASRAGPWQEADPSLRQGFWRGYAASGFQRSFDSGALSRMGIDITDDAVTVSVLERGFSGTGWQVIANGDGGPAPMMLTPGYSPTLPEFAHGMRRLWAYRIPTDGEPHEVPLSSTRAEQSTWVGDCGVTTPHQIRTVTLDTPDGFGLIPCASYRREWATPMLPMRPGSSAVPGAADSPTSEAVPAEGRARSHIETHSDEASQGVTLTAPKTSERARLTVAAYLDVPYTEFPFDVLGQPSTSPLALRPVPDEGDIIGLGLDSRGTKAWRSVDTITQRDLDARGRATLAVPAGEASLLSVTTQGKGRFRVAALGADNEPLDGMFEDPSAPGRIASPLMYRDGWWTSWTTASTTWSIPVPPILSGQDTTLEVHAQDYDPGSLRIAVTTADSGDGTLNR